MKKIKIGILGGAINSAVGSAHISAIRLSNSYEIIAGCFSRNNLLNIESGIKYGISKENIYENFYELVVNEKNNIDAILILTPTNQHKDQILFCIKNNISIICEKALVTNVKDANEILNLKIKNNTFISVIYNYLGYPMIRELKFMIKNNQFGKINHIQIEMPQEGFKRLDKDGKAIMPQAWRLKDEYIPTISLDLGVHLHILIKYLIEEKPLKVSAIQNSHGNFNNIVDNINCLINYTNNISCSMWYSKSALGKRNGMKINIYGEKKSAEWIQEYPEYLTIADQDGQIKRLDRGCNDVFISNQQRYTRFKAGHPAGFIEAFANYYEDIAINLNNFISPQSLINNSECFGVEESIEGLELFEAISKSCHTLQWVKTN
jgi:predicted dehydrogenase